jgi:PiT family inorganic phosphate transporter
VDADWNFVYDYYNYNICKKKPGPVNKVFGKLQLVSSVWFAVTHGANDGQKTMGIIVLILMSQGILTSFEVPIWVILAAASAIALGTFIGGFKVIKTLGVKIARLGPYQCFAAETGGGLVLAVFASLGIPASTTHAITGSIMGAGATRRKHTVRWKVGKQIVATCLLQFLEALQLHMSLLLSYTG